MSVFRRLGDYASRASSSLSEAWYGPPLLPPSDTAGTEEEYRSRYEDVPPSSLPPIPGESSTTTMTATVLGEGEFGEVLLVREKAGIFWKGQGEEGKEKEVVLAEGSEEETIDDSAAGGDDDDDDDDEGHGSIRRRRARYYACKVLRKGYSMKHNVVYSPPLPGVLAREVRILRVLGGRRHCLRLEGAYEGPRFMYLVCERCRGGDLTEYRERLLLERSYVASASASASASGTAPMTTVLSAEVVRDVAIRLLSAVDHCATNGIIHRDIKPANVMFVQGGSGGGSNTGDEDDNGVGNNSFVDGLRLIDFGSGCIKNDHEEGHAGAENENGDDNADPSSESSKPNRRSTMAGSAFYNSPEMFRRDYDEKTDVWSAGVTVYAFACGFPRGDRMQKVFDSMHRSPRKGRDLKGSLIPPAEGDGDASLPDSFWKMLDEGLLVYWDRHRLSAGKALETFEFLGSGAGENGEKGGKG